MEKAIINQKEAQKGITLIALVITIIVLLILAGVSIAMLTGQNGILTQANNAKNETELASAKEKVELAVIGAISQTRDGTLTVGKLRTELANYGGTVEGDTFPVTATVDGKSFTVDNKGNVTSTGSSDQTPTEQGTLGTVTGSETKNTTVKDSLGNQVVVPAGFKVINPNDNVTNGIVVEDVTHEATKGSQFVWIPVGDVIKDSAGNKETITLGRYVFNADESGSVNTELSKTEPGDQLKTSSSASNYFTEGLKDSTTSNTHAKDIEDFKNKVTNTTHGYYIGRYEARKNGTQVTVKASDTVYNNITQPDAATVSRGMYSDSNFESDLMNSYAWDTAIVFLQKFDNRANKTKPYSRQNSLNTRSDGLASQGTNNLSEGSKQDVICNVYDMASNCWEWTTEACSSSFTPCTSRGGYYGRSDYYTSYRYSFGTSGSDDVVSFRSLLYM